MPHSKQFDFLLQIQALHQPVGIELHKATFAISNSIFITVAMIVRIMVADHHCDIDPLFLWSSARLVLCKYFCTDCVSRERKMWCLIGPIANFNNHNDQIECEFSLVFQNFIIASVTMCIESDVMFVRMFSCLTY